MAGSQEVFVEGGEGGKVSVIIPFSAGLVSLTCITWNKPLTQSNVVDGDDRSSSKKMGLMV